VKINWAFGASLLLRMGLGVLPLVIGVIVALGVIVVILHLEANITSVILQEITLTSEAAALQAHDQMKAEESVKEIAEALGDSVDSFASRRMMTQSQARRLPPAAAETLFTLTDKGTVVGPYEVRDGWYVARIESQAVISLSTIYELIEARVLSQANKRADILDFWLPVMLCSCGLLLTFSAGLWNIGIEGQMAMGAIGASGVALFMELPRHSQLMTELGMAAAAGGGWALLTAVMKTRGGVNEIFGGVAMNFIASNFLSFLLVGPWAPPNSSGSSTALFPQNALLPSMRDYRLSPITIYLTVGIFIFVLLTLAGSRWGLQLRAMGRNPRSAQVLGVPTERNIWLAMMLCGMIAGLAGGHLVLFTRKNLPANVSGGIGFLSLLVVLLASVRGIWVPWIALAFAALYTSGLPLRTSLQLDSSLIGVFVGLPVFGVLIFNGVRRRGEMALQRRRIAAEAAQPPPMPPVPAESMQEAAHGN
jgi:ABC-type uncharacterized transport system permease subunit